MYKITVEKIKVRIGSQVKTIEVPVAIYVPSKKRSVRRNVPEWFKNGLLLRRGENTHDY